MVELGSNTNPGPKMLVLGRRAETEREQIHLHNGPIFSNHWNSQGRDTRAWPVTEGWEQM